MYKTDHAAVPRNVCQRFGDRIRELRLARGVTQDELSERVGVFRTYMSRIETGVANPTLTLVQALADALGLTLSELVDFPPAQSASRKRARSQPASSRGRVVK